jgi:hypothetical protein
LFFLVVDVSPQALKKLPLHGELLKIIVGENNNGTMWAIQKLLF